MKIGILTYHSVPNFGAQLQATSTVGYLRRMGHIPIVLNWYPKDLEEMYSKRVPETQILAHNHYTERVLPVSSICRTEKELTEIIEREKLDAILIGSDALFKYVPNKNRAYFNKRNLKIVHLKCLSVDNFDGNPFFGGFISKLTTKIPIMAFAVSSQNCPYKRMTQEERIYMKQCMDNFSYISVRDEWTKQMVQSITRRNDVIIAPDPVFSFNQNLYMNIPKKEEILIKYGLQENYILLSFSTWHNTSEYIATIANEVKKRGFQAVAFPMPEKLFSFGLETKVELPLDPLDWYALILYSKGYIGERMHPIVVCLHNSIPFYCFDEYGIYARSLWGLRKKYLPNSSKTYLIVKEADLLSNLYSYKSEEKLPDASFVMDKIVYFSKDKCDSFAKRYQSYYEECMQFVLNSTFQAYG